MLLLVPVHIIAPPFRMFENGPQLMRIGQGAVTAYELAMLLIVLTIIILGTRLRYLLLTLSGLVGRPSSFSKPRSATSRTTSPGR